MPASTITWLVKIDGFDLGDPQKNVNAADMNEIKTVVNTNAASFDLFVASFVDAEVPSGTMNSVNTAFTIANTPIAGSVQVYWNGQKLRINVGYTISGTTLTMTTPPDSGDILEVYYRKII